MESVMAVLLDMSMPALFTDDILGNGYIKTHGTVR